MPGLFSDSELRKIPARANLASFRKIASTVTENPSDFCFYSYQLTNKKAPSSALRASPAGVCGGATGATTVFVDEDAVPKTYWEPGAILCQLLIFQYVN